MRFVSIFSLFSLLIACSSTPSIHTPLSLSVEKHIFWKEPHIPTIPDKITRPQRSDKNVTWWMTDLPNNFELELDPKSKPLRTCEMPRVEIASKDGDTLTFIVSGPISFTPRGSLKKLPQNRTITDTLVYAMQKDDTQYIAHPFAKLDIGAVVGQLSHPLNTDTFVYTCLDVPACTHKGFIRRAAIGAISFVETKRPEDIPVDVEYRSIKPGLRIDLYSIHGDLLTSLQPPYVYIVQEHATHAEVLVPTSLKSGGNTNRIIYHGTAKTLPKEPPSEPREVGGGPLGTIGANSRYKEDAYIYLRAGAEVFTHTNETTRIGFVESRLATVGVRKTSEPPKGWTPVWITTPWNRIPGYVHTSDIKPEPKDTHIIEGGYRVWLEQCVPKAQ